MSNSSGKPSGITSNRALKKSIQELVVSPVPILSSFNERIRLLLDAVDKLSASPGKSSVLESLAGISLPRGQDLHQSTSHNEVATSHFSAPEPELSLEYNGKTVPTVKPKIANAISLATDEIAGSAKAYRTRH
uniref:Uncharacterized protein n=1 Tax=Populus alba TaxID=43335 RepID=A0A4U5PLE3_POPAL|nr:hypothetical protein D5086_0000216500 [Populus alba]